MNFQVTSNRLYLLLHFILFYIIWALTEIFLYPYLRLEGNFVADIFAPFWKIIIWLVPVIFILRHKKYPILPYFKLNYGKYVAIWSIRAMVFIASYDIFMQVLFYGKIAFYPWLTFTQWINSVFIAGVVEEILFRGYFLQKVQGYFSFWKANLFVSLLFVGIHFPIWYVNADKIGHNLLAWLQLIAFIYCFSLLQGYLLRKSGSLWPCIMMHMMNNFMVLALVG